MLNTTLARDPFAQHIKQRLLTMKPATVENACSWDLYGARGAYYIIVRVTNVLAQQMLATCAYEYPIELFNSSLEVWKSITQEPFGHNARLGFTELNAMLQCYTSGSELKAFGITMDGWPIVENADLTIKRLVEDNVVDSNDPFLEDYYRSALCVPQSNFLDCLRRGLSPIALDKWGRILKNYWSIEGRRVFIVHAPLQVDLQDVEKLARINLGWNCLPQKVTRSNYADLEKALFYSRPLSFF